MCRFPPPLLLALGLGFVLASGASRATAAGASAAEILGLQTLSPPVEAPEFALDDVDGETVRLSDFRGRWVLLTVWATWCGPCRSEMPSLQRLWERQGDDGLVVVGVAVGSDPGNAADFVRRNGLTFPALLDAGDRVGNTYRASSIPLTYLVDPDGMLVGISRGARDWDRIAGAVAALVGGEAPDASIDGTASPPAGDPDSVAPPAPISLPATLVPPTGAATLAGGPIRVGEPFELQVEVRWSGDGDEYALLPPRVELPEGVALETLSASTTSLEGTQRVLYTVHLTAEAPGSYALDPIELRFQLPGREELLYTRISGPAAVVEQPPSRVLWIGAAAGVFLVLGGAGVWIRRRR